jgi:3-oxoacyl-[acyl-carrier-protein] synthase II
MQGPNFAIVSACATAGHAIGEASEIILRGDADVMIAGGAEAPLTEGLVGAFAAMRALSTRNDDPEGASRPFDQGRDGFVIAEGAGVVVLEELGHAEARGADILAEVMGYGATADASHITLPAPGGMGAVRAARRAIQKAGIDPTRSTTSTRTPRAPARATRPNSRRSGRCSATTPHHSRSAPRRAPSGTRSAQPARSAPWPRSWRCAMGCVPPTLNVTEPDPSVGELDVTPLAAKARDVRVALVNAFGFGGQNSVVLYRRWDA